MLTFAEIELAVVWFVWLGIFVLQYKRVPKRTAAVADPTARWGMIVQGCAYAIVGFHRGPLDPAAWRVLATIVVAPAAPALAWAGVRRLGRHWRLNAALDKDHELVRSGPYGIVRHPIYASMFFFFFGIAALLATLPAFLIGLALLVAGTEIRVRAEDRLLAGRFGSTFEEYRRAVPAYVPLLR